MEINQHHVAREMEKLFAKSKQHLIFKSNVSTCIKKSELSIHFETHFQDRQYILPPEIENPDQFPYLQDLKSKIMVNEEPPSVLEVMDVLKHLKMENAVIRMDCSLKISNTQTHHRS